MMVYKLTRPNNTSGWMPRLTWGPGVMHRIPEEEWRAKLCGPGILHAYRGPLGAVELSAELAMKQSGGQAPAAFAAKLESLLISCIEQEGE